MRKLFPLILLSLSVSLLSVESSAQSTASTGRTIKAVYSLKYNQVRLTLVSGPDWPISQSPAKRTYFSCNGQITRDKDDPAPPDLIRDLASNLSDLYMTQIRSDRSLLLVFMNPVKKLAEFKNKVGTALIKASKVKRATILWSDCPGDNCGF